MLTPLQARWSSRFGVATMLRTTPPPDGIGVRVNDFETGSNRTGVLGCTPDSLYQTMPLEVAAMP